MSELHRKARRVRKAVSLEKRSAITKASLLVSTALGSALVLGAMAPQVAFAQACTPAGDNFNCAGADANGETVNPTAANSTVTVTGFVVSNPGGGDVFVIDNAGSGSNVTVTNGGNNSYTATGGNGDAIEVTTGGGNFTANQGFGGPISAQNFGEGLQVTTTGPNGAGNINITTAEGDTINVQSGNGVDLDARGGGGGSGGNIFFKNNDKITGTGDFGIRARTDGNGSSHIVVNAPIDPFSVGVLSITGAGANTVDVDAPITAVNAGVIALSATGTTTVNVNADITTTSAISAGVLAATIAGPVTVNTAAGTTVDAGLLGIGAASLFGDVTVNAQGTVIAREPLSIGILALSGAGNVDVTAVDVQGGLSGITAFSIGVLGGNGHVNVTSTGDVTGGLTGIFAGSVFNDVTVNAHNVSADSSIGTGIFAGTATGNVDVTADGTVSGGFAGIFAANIGEIGTAGHVTVDATNVDGTAQVNGGLFGIFAGSVFDDVTVNADNVSSDSSIGTGIFAGTATGNVDVTVNGNVTGSGFAGIFAANIGEPGNDGHVNVTVGPNANVHGGLFGVSATSVFDEVHVTNQGTVDSEGIGIFAASLTDNVTVDGGGNVGTGTPIIGILALSGAGDVTVDQNDIHAQLFGVIAASALGNVDVTVNNVTVDGIGGFGVGIVATSLTGNVDVQANNVSAPTTGIFAFSVGVPGGGGHVNVTSTGDVDSGLFGIFAGSVFNDVTVNAHNVSADSSIGTGIFAGTATGNVDVTADGTVSGGFAGIFAANIGEPGTAGHVTVNATNADGTAQVNGGLFGIFAGSVFDDVTVRADNVSSDASIGTGIFAATATGNVDVTVNGNVTGSGFAGIFAANIGEPGNDGHVNVTVGPNANVHGGLFGVSATSVFDEVHVTNQGTVDSEGIGIFAASVTDNVTVDGGGNVGTGTPIIGILATSVLGDVTVDQNDIHAQLFGVIAASVAGNVDVTVNNVTVDGIAGFGIGVSGTSLLGSVSITTKGTVTAPTIGIFAAEFGDGAVNVTANGPVTTTDGDAIFVLSTGGGDVNVTTGPNAPITAGGSGDGIFVLRFNGDGAVNVNAQAAITAGDEGIQVIRFNGDGDVTVASAAINAVEDGIQVIRFNGDGAVNVTANGTVTSTGEDGIQVIRFNGDGDVTVTTAAVNAVEDGIQVVRFNGDGLVSVTANGPVTSTADDGIQVIRFNGDGDVVVAANGAVTALDQGIQVIRFNGDGAVDVTSDAVTSNTHDAIQVIRFNGDGDVQVTNNGALVAFDDGIQVIRFNGDGNVTVNANADITAGDRGIDIFKRAAGDGPNDVFVNVAAGATVDGTRAISINTRVFGPQDSAITITNAGTLIGDGTWVDPTIRLLNDGGDITINNAATGLIQGRFGLADEVIVKVNSNNIGFIGDADVTINNEGTMIGQLKLYTAGLTNVVNNSGLWITSGSNRIGFGDDQINNSGLIITGGANAALGEAGYTDFKVGFFNPGGNVNNSGRILVNGRADFCSTAPGFQCRDFGPQDGFVFNNYLDGAGGLLDMRNGVSDRGGVFTRSRTDLNTGIGDTTFIHGLYNGGGYSRLGEDVFIAAPGPASSDLMLVRDGTSGRTGIIVNDLNNGAPSPNRVGIPLVYVGNGQTGPGNFVLDPGSTHFDPSFGGVINKGLWTYHLRLDPAPVSDQVSELCFGDPACLVWNLRSDPSALARQLPTALTAAQNLWFESALLWEDRQNEIRNAYYNGTFNRLVPNGGADMAVKAPLLVPVAPVMTNVWLKGLGSWTKVNNNQAFTVDGGLLGVQQFPVDLGWKQDTYGVIGGVTLGKEALFNPWDAVSFGPMGGWVHSTVNFNERGTSFKYDGGTVGVTATYMNGGFYFDNLIKADFVSLSFNAPDLVQAGLTGLPSADVQTYGWIGQMGYRWNVNRLFFEPLGTLAYSVTHIDDLNTLNTLGANINWSNGDSFKGALGGRIGAVLPWWATPLSRLEASLTGRVWHQFSGDNSVLLASTAENIALPEAFGFGTFTELKAGIDWLNYAPGWSGFVNTGVKFNDDFHTVSLKGGVNYRWDWR